MYINRVELQGRVGSVRMNQIYGKKVVNFSLATERVFNTENNTPVIETAWHNVVAWASSKNVIDQIQKGSIVHLTGYIRTSLYTSADGTEKKYVEISATELNVIPM